MLVTLPFPDPALFPNAKLRGGGWGKAMAPKAKAKEFAYFATKQAVGAWRPPAGPIPLAITFYPPDKRVRDLDGLLGAAKHAIDGIALALGIDDQRFRPIVLDVGEPQKAGRMVVQVGAIRTNTSDESNAL